MKQGSKLDLRYKNCHSSLGEVKARKKINYDELIYNYLESSLSGEIIQHVESTKKWLKENKKESKKVVKKAELGLKKTLENHLSVSNQIFCSQKKTLTRVINNFNSKVQCTNIFDKQRMQKIITGEQRQMLTSKQKAQSQRKIKIYLHLISKLDKKKRKQINKEHINYTSERNQSESHESLRYKSPEYHRGASLFKNQEVNFSYNNTPVLQMASKQHSFQNISIEGDSSYNSRTNSVMFHPLLSQNLGNQYEGKKKNRNRLKFMLNKGKNGQFS